MTQAQLRDDAERMLRVIAADMLTVQTGEQQKEKSRGRAPAQGHESAAHDHGIQRFEHGFDINQMVSEYRALRASVIRLWAAKTGDANASLDQLIRFNESIDQSIAESISRFTNSLEKDRQLFLAALSHDLRTPLGAVLSTAETIKKRASAGTMADRADRIIRSAKRMKRILLDLLDLTRTRLGDPLRIDRLDVDVAAVVTDVVNELQTTQSDRQIELTVQPDSRVNGDPDRIAQVASNLIANAVQHGHAGSPIEVAVVQDNRSVNLSVTNRGPVIPESERQRIFEPLVRGSVDRGGASSMGLGLYIVRQIVVAHGGTVSVASTIDHGTTFVVRLPKAGVSPGKETEAPK